MDESNSPKKWLIFPLEIVERELDGKLLIAGEALKRGWGCIIGTKAAVRESLEHLPRGVIFLKSVIISELGYMRMFRDAGHKLVCLDEEGLVQNNLEHMVTVRSTEETLAELDGFLLWGQVQKKAYEERYPGFSGIFRVVGNPRADLWGKQEYHRLFQAEADKIREKFGDYFILPTSFGAFNHFMGTYGAMSIYKVDKMISDEEMDFIKSYRLYVKNIYQGFVELIEPLSRAFPGMNIVVRPHPSENREPWDEIAKKHDNVHVEFSGSVSPWLLASKAILHCGSTTAVEGHLMGRPVVSYCRGERDYKYELEVPAAASVNLTEAQDVLRILREIEAGEDINAKYPEVAKGHEWLKGWIENMDGSDSAQMIMDVLEGIGVEAVSYEPQPIEIRKKFSLKEAVWAALAPLEKASLVFELLPFRIKQGIRSRRYGKSKTKNIDEAHISRFMETLSQNLKEQPVRLDVIRRNLIAIDRR